MAETAYQKKLRLPLWQKKRLEVLERYRYCCVHCYDTETELHVNHKYYQKGKDPWDYPDDCFVTVCKYCHKSLELLKTYNPEFELEYIYRNVSENKFICTSVSERTCILGMIDYQTDEVKFIIRLDPCMFQQLVNIYINHNKNG